MAYSLCAGHRMDPASFNGEPGKASIPQILLKILPFLLFFTLNLYAQEDEIQFSHLTAEDGLSINGVTQIIQDNRGFIWFGTYDGLDRYDGYNFKIFLPDPSNSKSISNHSIWSLCEDNEGFIWIATLDGLNKYNWRTEEFTVYRNDPKDPHSLSSNNVITVYEDRSGIIWVGTNNGLNKYNRDKDNFTVIKKVTDVMNTDSLNSITCIRENYKGILWLGTWNGISCMQKDGRIIGQYYGISDNSKTFDYRHITFLYEDNLHRMWIGLNGDGLDRFDPSTGKFTHFETIAGNSNSISNNYINIIYQDNSGTIWIGTKGGLNQYNPVKNNFIRIMNDPEKPLSIIDNEILTIKEDNTGLIWIGTDAGVSRCSKTTNKFGYYLKGPGSPDRNLISSKINAVYSGRNKIWVGVFGGFDEIDPERGTVIHHRKEPSASNTLSDIFVRAIYEDSKGIVWVGTNGSGLSRYDPATGQFKSYNYDINNANSLSNSGVVSILEDHKGFLWVGTWWGLNRLDQKTGSFYKYHANPSNPNSLTHDLIWSICEDSKGMIWLGTDGGGASMLDPESNLFTNFKHDVSNARYISASRVFTIFESKDGMMWFGTSAGLDSYDRKTGKIKIYDMKSGLPGNLINGIEEDGKGYLWIATDNGLSRFDRTTNTFSNHSKKDGLKDLEFSQGASAKSRNGTILFGSKKGLLFFKPDEIKDEYLTAPVVFTDLKIYNQSAVISQEKNSVLKESIISARSVKIPYRFHDITIEFALLDYFDAKRNTFRYKLEGFDGKWNDVGTRNNATYTNLPPGEYRFIVRASDNRGVKNEKEASLIIDIIPEYYQTWWFKITAALCLILLTILTIHYRTNAMNRRNKILEAGIAERTIDLNKTIGELNQEISDRKKAEAKVQASLEEKEVLLKEIHHRVKNNLQTISSMLYLQSFTIKDKEIQQLFEDSQSRIRTMALIHEKLYQSKNLAEIYFEEYINSLLEHLGKLYIRDGIEIKTKIFIKDVKLSIDNSISCGLIVNELITNAYKYAFPSGWADENRDKGDFYIEIRVDKLGDNKYALILKDNGIGISENLDIENSSSLGLRIVNSMTKQLKGTLEILRHGGTEFKITFKDELDS